MANINRVLTHSLYQSRYQPQWVQIVLFAIIALLSILFSSTSAQTIIDVNEKVRCAPSGFCSEFLVTLEGRVVLTQRKNDVRVSTYRQYYGAIAVNPQTLNFKTAEIRGDNSMTRLRQGGGSQGETLSTYFFTDALKAENKALQSCFNCEVVISFRNGCAALAYTPNLDYFYTYLKEYGRGFRGVKTSGIDPNLKIIEEELLNSCKEEGCRILTSLCTPDPWN